MVNKNQYAKMILLDSYGIINAKANYRFTYKKLHK